MNSARKYLIPFPTSLTQSTGVDDTVFAMPKPEKLFQPPPPKWSLAKVRVPRVVSGYACVAAIATGTLIGVIVGRTTAIPPAIPVVDVAAAVPAATTVPADLQLARPEAQRPAASAQAVQPRKFRFRLIEAGAFQRVGPFLLRLKRADVKRQTFTLTLQAKDSRVELQDRPLAESIRLSPAGELPHELLVHRIEGNSIEGFMMVQRAIR